jgi:hypothetical protein
MKVKASELTDLALDWAVTLIENPRACEYGVEDWRGQRRQTVKNGEYVYRWHQSWAQGGPIIVRERIELEHDGQAWWARIKADEDYTSHKPLTAAMRCHVAFNLGDEVEIPDELINNRSI